MSAEEVDAASTPRENPAKVIQTILKVRGIAADAQEAFLAPDFTRDTYLPAELKGIQAAAARIAAAVRSGEVVTVFGDYDADGVPATALLVRALQAVGATVVPHIPTRSAGYGLGPAVLAQFLVTPPSLLVTVDNGTVAKEAVAALTAAKCEVIIIDHHLPEAGQVADTALAIINPKQDGCQYPEKELCACALAWKVAWAVYDELGESPERLKWYLDLVALATVADMVPLRGENRVLVRFGLQVMRKSRSVGLQALAAVAGVDLASVSTGDLGYRLAPRLNAPGRMHADRGNGSVPQAAVSDTPALSLLLTDDAVEARQVAQLLDAQNTQRQQLVDQHLTDAYQQAEAQVAEGAGCLVVYAPNWSSGVIGLVAGKLAERYSRPAIAFAREGDELKGSVRSVDGVHALELIRAAHDLLARSGGHVKAAGLSVSGEEEPEGSADLPLTSAGVALTENGANGALPARIRQIQERVNQWLAAQGVTVAQMQEACRRLPDLRLHLNAADVDLVNAISTLEPFGIGFPKPLFQTEGVFTELRTVGREQQHLSGQFDDGSAVRKVVGFGMGSRVHSQGQDTEIERGVRYRVVYSIGCDRWQGRESAVCYLERVVRA